MGAKRALIVDDSRSARAFLSRILEKYAIDVDSAESAEQAIEYLWHHRPDVIFMDHMMPGMDGFQAVQAIKNNPRTAMIPIMMYTSQEGELYLGQARALGAIGVLPKQIKPADVSKVLYQLHLVPDRRAMEQSSFRPILVDNDNSVEVLDTPDPPEGPPLPPAGSKPLTEAALRELFAELRRALVASLDSQTERIAAEMRQMLQDSQASPTLITDFSPSSRPSDARPWGWVVAAAASILAVASSALLWQAMAQQRALVEELEKEREVAVARSSAASLRASNAASIAATPVTKLTRSSEPSSSAKPKPVIELVPYGSEPLSGSRLEVTRQVFSRLAAQSYRGAVDIQVFSGRFCLIGNSNEGYSLPPDETPYAKCDIVGAAFDDSVSPIERMPIAYANLIGGFRNSTRGAVEVRIAAGEPTATIVPYPPVSDGLTAGEWNRAGSANNRIEIRVR